MAGRTKVALSRKLAADFGVQIDPDAMETTEPSCRQAGGANWGGRGTKGGVAVLAHSFATMTECSRRDLDGEIKDGMLEVV
jgi:hypothetical protein